MREGFITMIFISFVVMLAIDAYAFKGIKLLTKNLESSTLRQTFHFTYWSITIIVMIIMFIVFTNFEYANKVKSYLVPFGTMAIIIMHVVPKLVFIAFHLVEDIGFLGIWGYKKVIPSAGEGNEIISRSTFLTKIGLTLASAQLAGFAYGIAKGRYDFRIEKQIISFENLPKEFHGLKVAQISDIHIGSFFNNKDAVKKGVELVNSLNADLILL